MTCQHAVDGAQLLFKGIFSALKPRRIGVQFKYVTVTALQRYRVGISGRVKFSERFGLIRHCSLRLRSAEQGTITAPYCFSRDRELGNIECMSAIIGYTNQEAGTVTTSMLIA